MEKSESQKDQVYTTMINRITVLLILILVIAAFITMFMFGKITERERIAEYNDRLKELCEWIDGYEIVYAEYDYEINPPITYTWTLTRLNNGIEETITVEDGTFKNRHNSTCPIDRHTRVSPDNKYHIVEDNGMLVVYRPNDYYDTVSKSKYSSK